MEEDLFDNFYDDKFACILYSFDFLSVIPSFVFFFFNFFSLTHLLNTENIQLVLRCLELFSSGKILRITKDIPNILAIRITLVRAFPDLILPFYFFFVFNILFGVLIYFIEPCYQDDICPWSNLFEACFYSVVTMTTSRTSFYHSFFIFCSWLW